MRYILRIGIFPLLAIALPAFLFAQTKLTARGYLKSLTSIQSDSAGDPYGDQLYHHRLNLHLRIDSNWSAGLEFRHRLLMGDGAGQRSALLDPVGMLAPVAVHASGEGYLWHLMADRAWVQYAKGPWEVRAGRQRMQWGMNYLWNPLDWFNTWAYFDFDYEERPAFDGIRITRHIGNDSRMDVAAKFTRDLRESVAAARWAFPLRKNTLQVQAGSVAQTAALGVGWSRPVKAWGLKAEGATFIPLRQQDSLGYALTVSAERVVGANSTLYLSALYNSSSPWKLASEQLDLTRVTAGTLSPLRATLFVRGSCKPSSLTELSLGVFVGPVDGTVVAVPAFNISMSDRWELMLLSQMAWGNLTGEYRSVFQGHFLRLRWSY